MPYYTKLLYLTKSSADAFLDTLKGVITRLGHVTVADLYSIAGESSHTEEDDYRQGWSDLSEACVYRSGINEYRIEYPEINYTEIN